MRNNGLSTLINMGNTCFMNSALQCLLHTDSFVDYILQNTLIKCAQCGEQINVLRQQQIQQIQQTQLQQAEDHQTQLQKMTLNQKSVPHCVCNCGRIIDLQNNPLVNFNPKNESLAIEFVKSVSRLCTGFWEENCRIQPETFYRIFGACLEKIFNTESFKLGDQQDSQECLIYILDLLHMGLSRNVIINIDKTDQNDTPHLAWANFLKKNQHSVITDFFYGLSKTCVECRVCKTISKRYDPFCFLSLSFPKGVQNITLEDMFKFYSNPEFLTGNNKYSCDKCRAQFNIDKNANLIAADAKYEGSDANKKIEMWMLPQTFIIDFKRYQVDMVHLPNGQVGMRRSKINAFVKCPLEIDMQQFLPPQQTKGVQNNKYEMYAAIYHSGVLRGGHYVAACKVGDHGWIKFDDALQESVPENTIVNSLIYVAFYRKKK